MMGASGGNSGSMRRRPPLRRRTSDRADRRRYLYSTDDDEREWAEDLEREYNEGYSDGVKDARRRKGDGDSAVASTSASIAGGPAGGMAGGVAGGRKSSLGRVVTMMEGEQAPSVRRASSTASPLPVAGTPTGTPTVTVAPPPQQQQTPKKTTAPIDEEAAVDESLMRRFNDEEYDDANNDEANDDDNDYDDNNNNNNNESNDHDNKDLDNDDDDGGIGNEPGSDNHKSRDSLSDAASIASNETFTLRERQEAINTSHPFGIRIWKPAIYKKMRSVQKIAEGDIHSIPGKQVAWTVWVGNLLWTLLFGTIFLAVCTLGSACCVAIFWSPSAQEYGKIMFNVGRYLFFPFGHYVELSQDENYLHEDEGEGHSISEYERWQAGDVEYGRLFFGPQRRDTATADDATSRSGSRRGSIHAAPTDTIIEDDEDVGEDVPLLPKKRRFFGRGKWNIGRVFFYVWFWTALCPVLYGISALCWLGVFSIPMARVTSTLGRHLRIHPLALNFKPASSYSRSSRPTSIILCTYRALGWNYYKYTIDGTNIIIINLMTPVFFVVFDYYILDSYLHLNIGLTSPGVIFTLSLASVVPLAYFIGQAVASISAQSSMGMGAAINAFFSTVVEVFLYSVALSQAKGDLVEGSIVGSILAGVLLLPGLSMCAGAIRRKTQRYNPRSAGVSSTMLVFAVIGAFAPSVFYQIFGPYELKCDSTSSPVASIISIGSSQVCQFEQLLLREGTFYRQVIRPLSLTCSVLLFVSYVIGLWFTLRTHAAMIWATPTVSEVEGQHAGATSGNLNVPKHNAQLVTPAGHLLQTSATPTTPTASPAPPVPGVAGSCAGSKRVTIEVPKSNAAGHADDVANNTADNTTLATGVTPAAGAAGAGAAAAEDASSGHDAPNWSRSKSTIILLGATLLYAIIAEILVDTVDVVLQNFAISQKLLGITVFALVPNTTEFLNAISFAINGNIALSMEIGSAYALQVCLLQIPALVVYSMWRDAGIIGPIKNYVFTLVFPRWDLWVVIFCVFLFSYIYAEGKSNYFKGSILILAYMVSITGFFFADIVAGIY